MREKTETTGVVQDIAAKARDMGRGQRVLGVMGQSVRDNEGYGMRVVEVGGGGSGLLGLRVRVCAQTSHPYPQIPNTKPQTPNPKPQIPKPKPQTPNPKP